MIVTFILWKPHDFPETLHEMKGFAVASQLVRSTPDQVVRVQALAEVIVLCS